MNQIFPSSTIATLSDEIKTAGLDKTKTPVKTLDLIPKDQLILIILETLDQFIKQSNLDKFSQFFVFYAYKKYSLKPQTAKFCQSFEYSLDIHSKENKEPLFLQYLFSIENNKDVIKFYLKSRKILMQFFFDDGSFRYHDAEAIYLELELLEQWVNVATRIFSDMSSPKSIERLNTAVIKHAVQVSNSSIRKTIDAASFLEHCVIEFLRVKGFIQDNSKSVPGRRSVSPLSQGQATKKGDISAADRSTPIKNTSTATNFSNEKDQNTSQNIYSSPQKLNIPLKNTKTGFSSSPSQNTIRDNSPPRSDYSKIGGMSNVATNQKGTNAQVDSGKKEKQEANKIEGALGRSPPNDDRTLYDLKKEKRFLTGELTEQTNERKRIEDNLEKVLTEYSDLSNKQDELVDFTMELHKNFLYLMEHLKNKKSTVMEDKEVQDVYNRLLSFNSYEKNHIEKLNKTGMFKNREKFLEAIPDKKKTS